MTEILPKCYPQIMIIIGVILQIVGGTLLYKRTQEYRTRAEASRTEISNKSDTISALSVENKQLNLEICELTEQSNVLGYENRDLNKDIRTLSTRISEQSEIIEKQITGGDAYGEVSLLHIGDSQGNSDEIIHVLYLNNRGSYPLTGVYVSMRDQKKTKERREEKIRNNEDPSAAQIEDFQYRQSYDLGNIGAHGGTSFGQPIKIAANTEVSYGFSIIANNGSFQQLLKVVNTRDKFYNAVYLTAQYNGEETYKVLVDTADIGFPGEKDGKIYWEDK